MQLVMCLFQTATTLNIIDIKGQQAEMVDTMRGSGILLYMKSINSAMIYSSMRPSKFSKFD